MSVHAGYWEVPQHVDKSELEEGFKVDHLEAYVRDGNLLDSLTRDGAINEDSKRPTILLSLTGPEPESTDTVG